MNGLLYLLKCKRKENHLLSKTDFHDKLLLRHVVIPYKMLVSKKVFISFYRISRNGVKNGLSFSCSRYDLTKSCKKMVTGVFVTLHCKMDSEL